MAAPWVNLLRSPRASWMPLALSAVTVVLLIGCVYRLIWMEYHIGPGLRSKAERQQEVEIKYLGIRGPIVDSNPLRPEQHNVLAVSYVVDSVYVDPAEATDPKAAAQALGRIFDASLTAELRARPIDRLYDEARRIGVEQPERSTREMLIKKIKYQGLENLEREIRDKKSWDAKVPGRHFVWVRRLITAEESAQVRRLKEITPRMSKAQREQKQPFQCIGLLAELERKYPAGRLASHVLGWTDSFGEGKEGIERLCDGWLAGRNGLKRVIVDARRRPITLPSNADYIQPRDGRTVVLNINAVVQSITESVLAQTVAKFEAESGVAVVMDPQTGAVLAMASVPTFSSADFQNADPASRRNRCLTDPFEPGSIFKWAVVAGALEAGVVTPASPFNAHGGSYTFGGRTIRDAHGVSGLLTVRETIVKSSNICMAQIGERMGGQRLYRCLRDFGFGQKTGIELEAEEDAGLLHPLPRWTRFSVPSLSFGQEIGVTAIQMITAFSAVANGGNLLKPRLIRQVVDPSDRNSPANQDFSKPQIVRRVISRETAAKLMDMLVGVVNEGTGRKAKSEFISVFGKTGTAQIAERGAFQPGKWTASFIGGAPADSPRVVCIVSVRKPNPSIGHYGGEIAAPAAKTILEKSLAFLQPQ